jgi:hypothetical protein
MAKSLFHIFVKPKAGVSEEQVKEKMDLAVDWYKYSDFCWVVKSTSDPAKWQTRLKPLVEPGGTLLIFKIDPTQRQGWIAKSFWEWLKDGDDKKA